MSWEHFFCTRTSFSSVARCKKAIEDQSKVSSSPSSTSIETQKLVRQNNPQSIILPVSGVGNITETRKLILQNTLEDELKNHFRLISQERFAEAQEKAFEELDYEECTEDRCIMMIQEMLQVENVFHLQVIGEGQDTQLSLSWRNLDEKRKETDVCMGCGTFQLNDKVNDLVEKMVGDYGIKKKSNTKNNIWHKGILENSYAGSVTFLDKRFGKVSLSIKLYVEKEKLFGKYAFIIRGKRINGKISEITNENIINKNTIKLYWLEDKIAGEITLNKTEDWNIVEGLTTSYKDGRQGNVYIEKTSNEENLVKLFIEDQFKQ